jgi:hypothetical protein
VPRKRRTGGGISSVSSQEIVYDSSPQGHGNNRARNYGSITVTRRPPTRFRRATSLAIIALAVAALFGATYVAERDAKYASTGVAVSVADASHVHSFIGRAKLATSRLSAARQVREWRGVIDAVLLGGALAVAANLWRRSVERRLLHQFRVNAVFARRRGPPLLHLAH